MCNQKRGYNYDRELGRPLRSAGEAGCTGDSPAPFCSNINTFSLVLYRMNSSAASYCEIDVLPLVFCTVSAG